MRTLAVVRDIFWVPQPNECHLILDDVLPPDEGITSAFALAFSGDRLLLAHLVSRGWDIPGGHREAGETPEATMRREVFEETSAQLADVELFGYQMIRVLAPRPERYRYPYPDSYQVFYLGRVASLGPLIVTEESAGRALLSPIEARQVPWVARNRALYEAALARAATKKGSS